MTQTWQIENFLDVRDGSLHINGVSAIDLANEYGTPLFVFSEARIKHNIARLQRVQEVIGCPLKVCYAAKAMSTMAILRTVKAADCDIEVNSGGELWKALKAGFTGDQIIFNGTSKEVWEIENAINANIYAIQVDSLYELSLIEQTAIRLNKTANVSLRLAPEIETDTHSGLQTALLTSKFGMMPDEAFQAFRDYKDSPHLAMNGIHLHVGSQNPDPSVYTDAFATLFNGVARILDETGIELEHVNVGGGFPVNYLSDSVQTSQMPSSVAEMLAADFEPIDAVRAAWNKAAASREDLLKDLTILIEPGRSIIADTAICLTTVRNAKSRPTNAKLKTEYGELKTSARGDSPFSVRRSQFDTDNWLLTDAGFNILLSMETYKWYYHLISASRASDLHTFPYKVAGPLCDGGDVYFDIEDEGRLPAYRFLPADVEVGEVLALLNCGAYSLAQASQYNGRFLPAVILIRETGEAELIRKRDGFEDLINNDIW